MFRRFSERNQTLKQVVARRRRAVFSEHWAVRHLTLSIPAGETFGIIGGNGAGKSTTLKMLAGILVSDEGKVRVEGRISALLELGAGFHPDLTGRENVFLNGAILGMPRRLLRDRFDEIVAFSGLEESIDEPVKTYSSGMFARLGFSVAVNVDPDVLLLDEVLAVGDEVFQRRCLEKVADLRSGGKTVVMVSHGLSELRRMCQSIAWIDHGRVRAIGPAIDVVNEYLESTRSQTRVTEDGRLHSGAGGVVVRADIPSPNPREGAPLSIIFDIEVAEPVDDPRLGFTVARSDGTLMVGHTIVLEGRLPVGSHRREYRIPSLPLVAGTYAVGTWLSNATGVEIDGCPLAYDLLVGPPLEGSHDFGTVSLAGAWS